MGHLVMSEKERSRKALWLLTLENIINKII